MGAAVSDRLAGGPRELDAAIIKRDGHCVNYDGVGGESGLGRVSRRDAGVVSQVSGALGRRGRLLAPRRRPAASLLCTAAVVSANDSVFVRGDAHVRVIV